MNYGLFDRELIRMPLKVLATGGLDLLETCS